MTNSQRLATVRSHLRWWLSQHANATGNSPSTDVCSQEAEDSSSEGENATENQSLYNVAAEAGSNAGRANPTDPIVSESILIRDGFYAGRTFHAADHRATWFMEPDELKIFQTDGEVVAVFRGKEITADHQTQQVVIGESAEETLDDGTDSAPGPVSLPMPVNEPAASESHGDQSGEGQAADDQDGQLPQAA
jgi:hypothetical protein